jgi:hypothetical protein
MPYTTREALIVALAHAEVEPLHEVHVIVDKVIPHLGRMGFVIVDVHEERSALALEVALAAYDEAFPKVMPPRLAHLKAVEAVPAPDQDMTERLFQLERALRFIKHNLGQVCAEFAECTHTSCHASCSAWMIADGVLRGDYGYPDGPPQASEPDDHGVPTGL